MTVNMKTAIMWRLRPLIPIVIILFSVGVFAQKEKTLLAIFPHPDDESAIGEVLVKHARLGYKVQLVIATDGKDGTRVTDIPAGDKLAAIRREESRCAAKKIGIAEPIFLGIDRLDTRIGVGNYLREHKKLLALLKERIADIDPEFIITFGPDGDTHHAEHIVNGAAVTELLLREGWVEKYPLYFLAWTKEQGELFDLGYVNNQYLNIKIEYTQEEEDKALEMMPCYVSQFTPAEIEDDKKKKLADKSNSLYFRRFVVAKGLRNSFENSLVRVDGH
jgi:LmbE family N-acetylglucosaminyl deacetylase